MNDNKNNYLKGDTFLISYQILKTNVKIKCMRMS